MSCDMNILDAPWIRQAEQSGEPEDTSCIGECHYCGKKLYKNPVMYGDEYTYDEVYGYVCRDCFGTKFFEEIECKF